MARTETLVNLRTQVRERGEVRAVYVSDAALTTMINQSIADLYGLLVAASPDYYLSSSNISVVSGTDTYSLPATFWKLMGADYVESATNLIPLRRFNWSERNYLSGAALSNIVYSPAAYSFYRVMGDNLIFTPMPNWTGTVKLWFIPAPTKLVNDNDTFDGIAGWEEWVVLDAVMKCLAKEESDVKPYLTQKQMIEERIKSLASDRDESEPDRVRDVCRERHGIYGEWDV